MMKDEGELNSRTFKKCNEGRENLEGFMYPSGFSGSWSWAVKSCRGSLNQMNCLSVPGTLALSNAGTASNVKEESWEPVLQGLRKHSPASSHFLRNNEYWCGQVPAPPD